MTEVSRIEAEKKEREKRRQKLFESLGVGNPKLIVSEEVAEDTFDAILRKYNIDFDNIVIENGKEAAETYRNMYMKAIREGRMSVEIDDEKGFCITQQTYSGQKIVYREYNQRAGLAYAKGKNSQEKIYKLMGVLCGGSEEIFANKSIFNGPDVRLAEEIANIFFW